MGNRHDGAFEVVQETFQPRNRFGIGGWWVRRAAAYPAFPATDGTAPRGGARRRTVFRLWHPSPADAGRQLRAQAARSDYDRRALDNLFKPALLCGQLVEVGIRIGVQRVHFIQTFEGVNHFRNGLFNRLAYRVFRV